ncbi:ROK family protein [Alteribacter aurantiacus]|uniref:ROK family protein n=1 Tax=Alteribacter aurantiacus TaxID=254410 RepID=UPI00040A0F65|nr:ROK family protein [Alteribacter aurantiacus]
MGHTIGIDLGGTSVRVALVSDRGEMEVHEKAPSEPERGVEAFLNKVCAMVERVKGSNPVGGIGLGAPGPLDPFNGLILDPPNLPGWQNVPITKLLEERTGLPVTLDNDANAAALAEARFGAGRGEASVVYITVSTGVGAGIVIDGQLFLGAQGNAGEIGNMIVEPGGYQHGDLNPGALEALASGTAIGRVGRERLGVTGGAIEVFERADQGEKEAVEIIGEAIGYLAIGVANLSNAFNPSVFVFGGGVMEQKSVLPLLQEKVSGFLYPSMKAHLKMKKAGLGTNAGVIGAALLPGVKRLK